ncbi:serine hydrolase [Pseudoalteromonas luteoviolacea]|uniref:serine hydrolase n=1 Tax=Pseudoalteromonas luteoviolacea TaxID=43657 RepID=UPI001F37FE3C|nr:serine hydrolase [Pseudoalteromonas luteoviolacea]MCF6443016.1 serine hydrolase [Pseudoalteromonas luteoviolacea]
MTTDIMMPNGSTGKKLTVLLVALLAEDGVVDLDAPISKNLDKELLIQIQYSNKMAFRSFLNHTSGIFEYNDVGEYVFLKAQYAYSNKVTTDMFPLGFVLNCGLNFNQ